LVNLNKTVAGKQWVIRAGPALQLLAERGDAKAMYAMHMVCKYKWELVKEREQGLAKQLATALNIALSRDQLQQLQHAFRLFLSDRNPHGGGSDPHEDALAFLKVHSQSLARH
jgi:hypothetical protein